jgi:fructose-1,6-bisphosphatase I
MSDTLQNTTKRKFLTLDEFTVQQLRLFPKATGELSSILRDIGLAAKRINAEVNRAGLQDILGYAGFSNVQGEQVKKLDVYANDQMKEVLAHSTCCAGICSEEEDDIVIFDDVLSMNSKYVVLFDPLDGSSNIENNISIGTIFSIYRRVTEKGIPCTIEDFLQPGNKQVAAGYIIYGSSTMLVYATKRGVNGFTLDPHIGEFCLSHPDIQCPVDGEFYSVNIAGLQGYSKTIQQFIKSLEHTAGITQKHYNFRYVGSMVADLHRNLLNGGIFFYPSTVQKPSGKLRLLYECNPFAFIYNIAGGKAIGDTGDILTVQPAELHERSPLYIGSISVMNELELLIQQND